MVCRSICNNGRKNTSLVRAKCNGHDVLVECHGWDFGPMVFETLNSRRSIPENFFDQQNIVDFKREDKSVFVSHLNYSSWSHHFVHGADMIPWLSEGIEKFLEQKWSSLKSIDRIRFKKKVTGDVKYTISSAEDHDMLDYANIEWKFTDDQWIQYAFCWIQVGDDEDFIITKNHIPLTIVSQDSRKKIFKEHAGDSIGLDIDHTVPDKWHYIQKMTENSGYMRSVIADIINHMYQIKFDWSWLVISYEDLIIHDGFNPSDLFNNSCHIQTSILGDCKKMQDGEWYKCWFSLIHPEKWDLLSWKTTLFVRS